MADIRKGDKAIVTLMSYPDTPIEGYVDSLGWGIAQQDGSTGFEPASQCQPDLRVDSVGPAGAGENPSDRGAGRDRTARGHDRLCTGQDRFH